MQLSKLRARMGMRKVAGVEIPRQNHGSKAFLQHRARAESAPSAGVEGEASKPRLDRPGRAQGGPACREDGGRIKPDFIKHPGALRESLHVKKGENIPAKKLDKATHSDNPTLRKRAVLAKTMRGWKHD